MAVAYRLWAEAVAMARGGHAWTDDGVRCVHWPGEQPELLIPFPDALAPAALDRALAFADDQAVQLVGCWQAGLPGDPDLEPVLAGRGFRPAWVPHWMAIALDAGPPDGAAGEVVVSLGDGDRARGTLVLPPDRLTAGLFDVHVDPAHRRGGLGTQITAQAMLLAARRGRSHLALNATGDGEALYRSLGFDSLGHGRTWYLW